MSELWGLIEPRAKGTVVNRAYRGSNDLEPMDSRHLDQQHEQGMERGSKKLLTALWNSHSPILMRLSENENCTVMRG